MDSDTERTPHEHEGTDWGDASTNQGTPDCQQTPQS